MDIVTHTLIGAVGASALWPTHPLEASLFLLGSVAPDLDAISRVLGKRVFLRIHQTWTHALPTIVLIGVLTAWLLTSAGIDRAAAFGSAAGLSAGMALHALLDWTNTYGVTLFAPLSSRRACREWVFFIDAVVISATLITLAVVALAPAGGPWIQLGYAAAMLAYWVSKAALRRRALRHCPPDTCNLLPSALIPWRLHGYANEAGRVSTFTVNALNGRVDDARSVTVLDADFADRLKSVPEYGIMRALSSGFHVVGARRVDGVEHVQCRDLRTRNFNTSFGQLDVWLGRDDRVEAVDLHV